MSEPSNTENETTQALEELHVSEPQQTEESAPVTETETKAEPTEPEAESVKEDDDVDDIDDEEDDIVEGEEEVVATKQVTKKQKAIEDLREHINIVFIGHVDAGKSTIAGNILYLSGMVDQRTIERYEREAKEKKHGTWFLAFIMDTNEEERAKGKTVEVGRAHFSSAKKRFTILDAPGHKNYVPNMIGGAAQADIGILVISARQGEFEAGFEGQGQTREHATLAKTLGVKQLIIVVNKMDEPSVNWGKERYDEIQTKLSPFLRSVGYNLKTDIHWIPISGYSGANLKERSPLCTWYKGPSLLELLDDLEPLSRNSDGPVRLPILDRYREHGITTVLGKLESGTLRKGNTVTLMPNKQKVEIASLELETIGEVDTCKSGEIVSVGLKDVNTDNISQGFVLCDTTEIPVVKEFEAQLAIVDLLPTKPILSAGYEAVIHVHTCTEEVSVEELLSILDKKTRAPAKRKPTFAKKGDIVTVRLLATKSICCELFDTLQQLGRFTLRDEGKTIAIGKITKILSSGSD